MARRTDAKHECPLYGRNIYWGECYEVQEVRDDEMDMALLLEPIDIEQANRICEKCRWYLVNESEGK